MQKSRQFNFINYFHTEHNEALIRVEMLKAPPPLPPVTSSSTPHKPRVVYKTTSTTTATKASSLVPIISLSHPRNISSPDPDSSSDHTHIQTNTKTKPKSTINRASPSTPKVVISANVPILRNDSENEIITSTKTNKSHHKNSYFYAGEIAVLTMSCVVFLGGLVAAVSIACVRRRKRRRHRRRLSHIPAIPVEVRLQKQGLGGGSRPVLFPMALPGHNGDLHPNNSADSSDATSETYTDGLPELHHQRSASFVNVHKTGLTVVCNVCRKIRKPNNHNANSNSHNNHNNNNNRLVVNGVARGVRDRDRGNGKSGRHLRGEDGRSLPSSQDSGIDGSDGQICHCCNNSSSESGRYFRKYLQKIFNN